MASRQAGSKMPGQFGTRQQAEGGDLAPHLATGNVQIRPVSSRRGSMNFGLWVREKRGNTMTAISRKNLGHLEK
jgi:hypothetical protein